MCHVYIFVYGVFVCFAGCLFQMSLIPVLSLDSVYHLISSTESCTVAARPNETLSLLCVHPPVQTTPGATSTSGSDDSTCHFRSFAWRRLEANGESTNVTETRRFSIRRGGGGGGGFGGGLTEAVVEEGPGRRVSLLRISGLQSEDLSRYGSNFLMGWTVEDEIWEVGRKGGIWVDG